MLRYIPYVGPWIAALLPIIVSLVTTPGWQQVAMVVSLFVVLELLSNNIMEPLLYGHSVGLSELSVIVAAIFWTWLWGPVGLVIATPITACLVVLSTHVPPLGAIGRLLGDNPALKPYETVYQRLLAADVDEADAILTRCCKEQSRDEALQVLLDALLALKRDLQAGRVSAAEGEVVISGMHDLLEELGTTDADEEAPERPVLLMGVPGRDPLDAVVLEITRALLRAEPLTLEVLSTDLMTGEALAAIEAKKPAAVVVPSLPPAGLAPARQLCMRLRARAPALPIVAARLGDPESEAGGRIALLETAGCTEVAASLDALKSTLQRIARSELAAVPPADAVRAASGRGG